MDDFPVTIYHNPTCGTSRNTLAMVREAGIDPTVVEYLKTGWTRPQLEDIIAAMGATARDILRAKEPLIAELGLLEPEIEDADIVTAMVEHPVLVNRPIVVTPTGTRLCRPADLVLPLLDRSGPTR